MFSIVLIASLFLSATATPIPQINDELLLNYALTLEHLENAFYTEALSKFDANAFTSAGFPDGAYDRFKQVADHEKAHVEAISAALEDKAVRPCTYNFTFTDPKSFSAVAQILEGVGTAAYTGAVGFVKDKKLLTAAATILATEARHAAFIAGAFNGVEPWSGAFETPLTFNEVFTLAASFITSCPESNPSLPFKAFPALTVNVDDASHTATVEFDQDKYTGPLFLALLTGLDVKFVEIKDGKAALPEGLLGTVYALVTKGDKGISDQTTLAGPAILMFNF